MRLQRLCALAFLLMFLGPCDMHAAAQVAPPPPAAQNFRISGTVVDALTGQNIARAVVFLMPQRMRNSEQSVTTVEDGRFAFENLAPGKYVLSAQRKGYLPQLYKQHWQFSTAIVVGPNLETENLRFELKPRASISGQVVDERNEPVRNAQAILFQQITRFGRHTTWREAEVSTDDRGRYRFGFLLPGVYFIGVSAQPWYAQRVTHQQMQQTDSSGHTTYQDFTNGEPELDVVYPITFFSHVQDLAEAVPITLRAGDSEEADISLQPVPALRIVVHSAASEYENVWAQVSQTLSNGTKMGVQANSQQVSPGVLEIGGLPPGKLRVGLVNSKDGQSNTRWNNIEMSEDVSINASEMLPSPSVSGIARFEDGSRQPGSIRLRLSNQAENEEYAIQVSDKGEFRFEGAIPPGTYDLMVGQESAAAVRALSATGGKVSGHAVEVGSGQDVKLNVVLSMGTGHVGGVAKKDGKPQDGVMVVLVPEKPEQNLELFRRDQSDSDGSFNLNQVNPGKYTVVAIENAWDLEWSTPAVIQKYLRGGEAVKVEADAKVDVSVNVQQ